MTSRLLPTRLPAALAAVVATGLPALALAQSGPRNLLEIEGVSATQVRNSASVPNDASGARFSVRGLAGDGPVTGVRVIYTRTLTPTQELVLLYAPLSISGTGVLPGATPFQGTTFAGGTATAVDYEFNSYRATWRYALVDGPEWTFKLGATAKIRDARIALSQGGVSAEKSNTGFVPLLHAYAERRLGERWTLVGDVDALAGGPGRAIDAGLRVRWQLTPTWSVQGGWRILDGGVDTREQFNFARFTSWTLGVAARF